MKRNHAKRNHATKKRRPNVAVDEDGLRDVKSRGLSSGQGYTGRSECGCEGCGGSEGGGVVVGNAGSIGGASGGSLATDAAEERIAAGVRVISWSNTGWVEATYDTDAHAEFIAVAPSLPRAMPWRAQRRWIWSFPPEWARMHFGERQMAKMPDGFCPLPIL